MNETAGKSGSIEIIEYASKGIGRPEHQFSVLRLTIVFFCGSVVPAWIESILFTSEAVKDPRVREVSFGLLGNAVLATILMVFLAGLFALVVIVRSFFSRSPLYARNPLLGFLVGASFILFGWAMDHFVDTSRDIGVIFSCICAMSYLTAATWLTLTHSAPPPHLRD